MHIVTTGVHNRLYLTIRISHVYFACVFKAGLLADWQRVHLGSKKNGGSSAISKNSNNTSGELRN